MVSFSLPSQPPLGLASPSFPALHVPSLPVLGLPMFSPATGLWHVCCSVPRTLSPPASPLENPFVKQRKASLPMSGRYGISLPPGMGPLGATGFSVPLVPTVLGRANSQNDVADQRVVGSQAKFTEQKYKAPREGG